MPNDILQDVFERLATALEKAPPADAIKHVEEAVRRDWGGERCYIGKRPEDHAEQLSRRDAAVRKDFRAGERVELLARRYGISVKRVRQIVAAGE